MMPGYAAAKQSTVAVSANMPREALPVLLMPTDLRANTLDSLIPRSTN